MEMLWDPPRSYYRTKRPMVTNELFEIHCDNWKLQDKIFSFPFRANQKILIKQRSIYVKGKNITINIKDYSSE